MDTLPLLCRVPLLPGESLWSYLTRLTAANCYTPSMFARLCKERLTALDLRDNLIYPKRAETFDILASFGCLTPRELADSSAHCFTQAPLWTELLGPTIQISDGTPMRLLSQQIRTRYLARPHHIRFCLDCLREGAYHRLGWTPKEVLVCLKHQRLLLDQCHRCRSSVDIQDVVLCRCSRCGADLTDATSDYTLEPFGIFVQATIQSWWGINVPAPAGTDWALPDQPVCVLHRLFEMLTESIEAGKPITSKLSERYEAQLRAFRILVNWPTRFRIFLRVLLEREVRTHSYNRWCDFSCPVYLKNDSSLAFWLCAFQDWPAFSFVQEVVDDFMAENNIQVCSKHRSTRILIEADEELQQIARPLAQKGFERVSRHMEEAAMRLYHDGD